MKSNSREDTMDPAGGCYKDGNGAGGGGGGGGDKSKKRSNKRQLKNEFKQEKQQEKQQHPSQLAKQTSLTSMMPPESLNDNDDDDGNESDSSTIGSTPDSSTASNVTISSEKENAAINSTDSPNTINRSSLMHQQAPSLHRHKPQQFARTLSEPIDDYNLNVRLRAIAHSTHQFQSDYRASVDPYLLDEVTRNLIHYSYNPQQHNHPQTQPQPQSPQYSPTLANKHQKAYLSPSQSLKNYNMSSESLTYCGPGSMYSLNTAGAGHYHSMDKGNYHLFQPMVNHGQSSHQASPSPFHRANIANMSCRIGSCDHYLTTTGCGMSSPYLSLTPYQNPYYYEHHNIPLSSSIMNNGKNIGSGNNANNATTAADLNTMDKSSEESQHDASAAVGGGGSGGLQQHKQHSLDEYSSHVNSKTEKIIQLESVVNILRNQLLNTEDLFKKALLSKKTLENANCDLITIVDKLKLDILHLEGNQKNLKEQNLKLEDELETIKTRLLEKETEISSLRLTMAKIVRATGHVMSENELALLRGKTIASDYIKNKLKENYHELVFSPYNRNHNYYYSEPSSRRESSSSVAGFSGGRFSPIASPRINQRQSPTLQQQQQQQQSYVQHQSPLASSVGGGQISRNDQQPITTMPAPIPTSTLSSTSMLRSTSFENMKMDSQHMNNIDDKKTKESEKENNNNHNHNSHHRIGKTLFSTLPYNSKLRKMKYRDEEASFSKIYNLNNPITSNNITNSNNNNNNNNKHNCTTSNNNNSIMSQSFPDEQQMLISGQASAYSTPNSPMINLKPSTTPSSSVHSPCFGVTFAQDDEYIQATSGRMKNAVQSRPIVLDEHSKPKGLKRIFSRKRSTSSLSGISDAFSRGGLRATSGPRLGFNSQEKRFQNVNLPFSSWNTSLVADWFAMIGLGMYVTDCKRWCKNGEHLMRATELEVEKELGIKNSLHRKKLRLAVASMSDEDDDLLKCAGKLDYLWVARWLDDIGLPQYKESFIDARIDGRVLHYLTIDDLLHLKVTSQLHFMSIKAAIKVLRENNYNGQCLKRRAAADETNNCEWTCSEVSVWSSHRIMEWLRSIDLSEYAPNLRGSGVHGALILYENAFNADLFATLLSIPTSKTLLRRHISAKFKQLVGDELSRAKFEFESMPNYQPLIPGAKIRAYKKGHFTLRKKRSDFDLSDYVCPMTSIRPSTAQVITKYSALNNHNKSNDGQSKTDFSRESPVSTRTIESRKKSQDNSDSSSLVRSERKISCSSTQSNHNQTVSNNYDAKMKSDVPETEDNRSIPIDVPDKLTSQMNEISEEISR